MISSLKTLWTTAKYWIIAAGVGFLYLLGYQKGKSKEQIKTVKGTLDNVQQAKKFRDSLTNNERVNRLHNKYKR